MLDLGAGLGTAMRAASRVWPSLEAFTAVDAVPDMVTMGRDLGRAAPHHAVGGATWLPAELPTGAPRTPHALVVLSYVLTELSPSTSTETVRRAWEATAGTLVLLMPGTPAGYAKIIEVRADLLSGGAYTTAPRRGRPTPKSCAPGRLGVRPGAAAVAPRGPAVRRPGGRPPVVAAGDRTDGARGRAPARPP